MININCVWESVMHLYKAYITIKKVSFYSSICFKTFFICKGENEITIFKNAVPLNKNIDSKKR